MSVQSDRRSDGVDYMLQENSYQITNKLPWNRNSEDNNKFNNYDYERRASNEGRTQGHACDCYPSCRGEECPCYFARTQMCIKDSCCQTCIQMKNALFMIDRGQFCSCKNTQCLKSYCKCFHNNGVCTSLCKCEDCKNKIDSKQRYEMMECIKNAIVSVQDGQRKFCTCKKTKCNKKYCSCFANGIKCSKQCQCENCINCDMIGEPISAERPPSFYNEEEFANIDMPERMSFEKVQFTQYTK